jgi:predicted nuclease of restriction endonuclease-like (RecB) superfamily
LSVRELRAAIAQKAFERREIANAQIREGSAVPRYTFSDPMILDPLGLHDTFLEKDLAAAILRDLGAFLMEAGRGFTFVASQKRMTVGKDDMACRTQFGRLLATVRYGPSGDYDQWPSYSTTSRVPDAVAR